MKIYVAGPMRGYYEFNFPAFRAAADNLRSFGHEVFSPAERDMKQGFYPAGLRGSKEELAVMDFDLREAIADDLNYICRHADAIYLLKGWSRSLGAKLEWRAAQFCEIEIWFEDGAERP